MEKNYKTNQGKVIELKIAYDIGGMNYFTGREIQMMYEKEIAQKRFDVNEVFDRYTENYSLKEADIFHLYDTGDECIVHSDGFHDSRHFRLIAFNTETMEKSDLGIHDGIQSISPNSKVNQIRVFADGSFFISFHELQKISNLQCVRIE